METIPISDLTIFVVEPSTTQRRIIISHLNDLNVKKVQYYSNGKDSLEGMGLLQPDLVISTMYLPDMTATDLVHSMRSQHDLQDVPFMLISSETSFASLDPIRQAGVIAILPKPFDSKDLKKALYSTVEFIRPDETALNDIALEDLKVLVVDDSPLARKHIQRVLTNLGIARIQSAADGNEAVQYIENDFYDLIITDYNMPEMDGEELTRHIRESSSQRSIPVLMVTSEHNDSRLAAVQQAGVSGICDKPFEPATVRDMIKNLLIDSI